MRVLITESSAYSTRVRKELPVDWQVTYADVRSKNQLESILNKGNFDIVFTKIGIQFDENVFFENPNLSILASPTTGLNHIDLTAAKQIGAEVVSLKGETTFLSGITSTAEHVWCLLLALNRTLPQAMHRVRINQWDRDGLDIHELNGSKLGIIGMGRLGRIIASYGQAFRMEVMACDPNVPSSNFPAGCAKVELKELISECRCLIMMASYNPGCSPILTTNEFAQMREGTILVNAARGELIDEAAMLDALDSNVLRGFAVDVLVGDSCWNSVNHIASDIIERSKTDSRIIITPHIGGFAVEAVEKTRSFLIRKVKKVVIKQKLR